jgi:membrane fusion protein (multidrug efflux system)
LDLQEIRMRLADLRDHTAELEASIARKTADLESLRQQREDRKVRAPSDGVIGELAEIRPGSVVQVGARLATILPDGTFHVVARFVPAAAIGRVLPGQTARVRLNGFPSEQYGRLTATVADIAGEVRDGTIKVDLALTVDTHSAIPLQHGQPGEVEINVGRSSPLDLIIRSAGHMIHSDPAKTEIKTALNGSNS